VTSDVTTRLALFSFAERAAHYTDVEWRFKMEDDDLARRTSRAIHRDGEFITIVYALFRNAKHIGRTS
jgi:hypothetical protein